MENDIPVMFGVITTENINRQLNVQEARLETKDTSVHLALLKW